MAILIPTLIKENFEDKVKNASEEALKALRSKCADEKIYKSEFKLEIDEIFRSNNLEAEQEDYEFIEIRLNNLNCKVVERFDTFDKFKV